MASNASAKKDTKARDVKTWIFVFQIPAEIMVYVKIFKELQSVIVYLLIKDTFAQKP